MGEKKKLCAKNGQTKNRKAANFLEKHKNGHVPKKMATMDGHQKSPTKKNRHFVKKKNRFTDERGTKKDVMNFSTVWACSLKMR